jgi:signal transduction histidine kinase
MTSPHLPFAPAGAPEPARPEYSAVGQERDTGRTRVPPGSRRPVSALWRAVRRGAPDETGAGVELVVALTFLGFRLLNLIQAVVSLPGGLGQATRPVIDLIALGVFTTSSTVLAVHVLGRRAYDQPRWGVLDAVTGIVVLLATALFTHPDDRFTQWVDWGYPVTISVAFGAGLVLRRLRHVAAVVVALVIAYLITAAPLLGQADDRSTAITNSLTYPVAAGIAWLLCGYLRRLGAAADAARANAAHLGALLGAADERQRHAALLHDHATVLDVFARADPSEQLLLDRARSRAAAGSVQIRAFLRGDPAPASGLAQALTELADDFRTLHITRNLSLAGHELPTATMWTALSAVRTALDNVLWHAGTTEVVLHAATTDDSWEITISDQGVGFDPATTPYGYGLGTQVTAAVTALGGTVDIASEAGAGTVVSLSGPR